MEIVDYPNYLIYEDGRVYNQKFKRYVKPRNNKYGYYQCKLCKNGKPKSVMIHRLVAIHYIPNPDNKPCIDHIDGNKINNNINNLRWVSHIENGNAFRSIPTNNTSGIKNISYHKPHNSWQYRKNYFGNTFTKTNKNKNLVLWVKFVDRLLFP